MKKTALAPLCKCWTESDGSRSRVSVRHWRGRGALLPPDHCHPRRELVRPLRLDDVAVRRRVDCEGVSALYIVSLDQMEGESWTHAQEHLDVGARNDIGLRDVDDLCFPLAELGVQVQVWPGIS